MTRTHGATLALAAILALAPASDAASQSQKTESQEKTATASDEKAAAPQDKDKEDKAPEPQPKSKEPPIPSNQRLNMYGVLPSSALNDGGMDLPVEMRVPEQYQYLRPDRQFTEGQLSGKQLPPVLTEFKVITKQVKPGDEVRVLARVVSPYNETAPFTSLFYNQELGRAAELYVNFKPDKKDKSLFRGVGKVSKYAAPGRYVVGTTIVPDAVGDRKAYWADFHKPMQEEDGSPAGFEVLDHPNIDVDGPTLKAVTVETKTARAGEDVIHYAIETLDDKSGPVEAEGVWASPSGSQWVRTTMVQRSDQPGAFLGAFILPQWYEGGMWKLQQLALKDDATNVRYYFESAEPLMKGAAVSIVQDPKKVDREPPKLLALQLSHKEAEVKDQVTITALVEDNLSGVETIEGYFRSPHGADAVKIKLKMVDLDLNRPSKIPEPNVWQGTIKLKDTMEMGTWSVARLGLGDRAKNFRTYFSGREPEITGATCTFIDSEKKEAETTEAKQ